MSYRGPYYNNTNYYGNYNNQVNTYNNNMYNQYNQYNNTNNVNINQNNNVTNLHMHPLVFIYQNHSFKCNGGCERVFNAGNGSYYCTLCDFDCCQDCKNKSTVGNYNNNQFSNYNINYNNNNNINYNNYNNYPNNQISSFRSANNNNLLNSQNNPFQINILLSILNKDFQNNINISPISIYQILSLTSNGAINMTQNEMLNVLNSNNSNNSYNTSLMPQMNSINSNILSTLSSRQSVQIANAILTRINPNPEFIRIAKSYNAYIDNLYNANQVNMWVSQKTNGKINNIIDRVSGDTKMILLNAVSFKGEWSKKFNGNHTRKEVFHSVRGDQNINMMHIEDKFMYYQNNNLEAVSLPYKENGLSAIIILPNQTNGNPNNISNLISSPNFLSTLNSGFSQTKVILSLPKFSFEYSITLNECLKSLGMVRAFQDCNEFKGISNEVSLYIDQVIHKTYIKVDENGTEAHAATAVVMNMMSCMPQHEKLVIMTVNRPFVFLIVDDKLEYNNNILFGAVIRYIQE